MGGVWDKFKETSPITKLVKLTDRQMELWGRQLRSLGLKASEGEVIPYWNILAAIYVITEEEGEPVRMMQAYGFSHESPRTGQRRLQVLIESGLVKTTENPDNRKEKFVMVSDRAAKAVLNTLDAWAENYGPVTAAYKKYRANQRACKD